jgi:hypothetical protein
LIYVVHHRKVALLHPTLGMDPPRDSPAVPPDMCPPRDSSEVSPGSTVAHSRSDSVPATHEDLQVKHKRNRDVEPDTDVNSEEHKRRKLGQMITQTKGEFCGRYDGDEDDNDELKMPSLRIEAADYQKKMQNAVSLYEREKRLREEAESDLRLVEQGRKNDLEAWQNELAKVQADLHKEHLMLREAESDVQRERLLRENAATELFDAQQCNAHDLVAWQEDLTMSEQNTQRERIMRERAQITSDAHQTEIEHLKAVNATMMSDLNELRVLENEVATKHKDECLGLPPAYGNLNDEDRFPPYSTHEDGGTIEVAHFKREIRRTFEVIVNKALSSELEKESKLELFGTLAGGLNKACDSLQKLLDIAPRIPVSCVRKPTEYGGYIDLQLRSLSDSIREARDCPTFKNYASENPKVMYHIKQDPPHTYLPGYAIIQRENSAPYVADRIAKLLLELLWRFAAACEIRPGIGSSPTVYGKRRYQLLTSIMLHFKQADSVFTKALQLAFSHKISMSKVQYHLSQLQQLSALFKSELFGQDTLPRFLFFVNTREWLSEVVEKERAVCTCTACRRGRNESIGDDDDNGNHDNREDDGASSRWEGSDAGSGKDEVDENMNIEDAYGADIFWMMGLR